MEQMKDISNFPQLKPSENFCPLKKVNRKLYRFVHTFERWLLRLNNLKNLQIVWTEHLSLMFTIINYFA